MPEMSDDQERAFDGISTFLERPGVPKPFVVLQGLAGTGKTFVLAALSRRFPDMRLAAYTGKAASVLRKRIDRPVTTMHSAIYDFHGLVEDERERWKMNPVFVEKEQGHLARRAIGLDECFVRGTPIDTPFGARAIENFLAGDYILNGWGLDQVARTSKRVLKHGEMAVRIKIGETERICSEDHRFFTRRGLVRAADLRPGDSLARTGSAVRLLRDEFHASKSSRSLLLDTLRDALDSSVSRISGSIYRGESSAVDQWPKEVERRDTGGTGSQTLAPARWVEAVYTTGSCGEGPRDEETKRLLPAHPDWWQWNRFIENTGSPASDSGIKIHTGIRSSIREAAIRIPDELQARSGRSCAKNRNRAEWLVSHKASSDRAGQEEDCEANFARVDYIELLEQGDQRLDRFRDVDGQLYLYDLTAERHHSFSIGGILVHNCSMIGTRDGNALINSGARIVACGDPGQLPPVRDAQFFTRGDYTLTKVHRQAWDSPIIRQAHAVRESGEYEADGEGFRVLEPPSGEKIDREELLRHEAILCWKNATRRRLNYVKRELLSLPRRELTVGEPVMCLQNQHRLGLYNGVVYEVEKIDGEGMIVREEGARRGVWVECASVEGFDPKFEARRYDDEWLCFALGYAMTVHRAQGSEYEDVFIYDEYIGSDHNKWLYTAITRAKTRCTILRRSN